jgi:hypothetical protein
METIEILQEPTFEYIASLGRSAFQKIEVVKSNTLVDCQQNREMIWHRYSYADFIGGPYDVLFSIPFGFFSVSGDPL